MKEKAQIIMTPATTPEIGLLNKQSYGKQLLEVISRLITALFPQHIHFVMIGVEEGDYWINTQDTTLGVRVATSFDVQKIKDGRHLHCKRLVASSDKSLGLPVPAKPFLILFTKKYNTGLPIIEVFLNGTISNLNYTRQASKNMRFLPSKRKDGTVVISRQSVKLIEDSLNPPKKALSITEISEELLKRKKSTREKLENKIISLTKNSDKEDVIFVFSSLISRLTS